MNRTAIAIAALAMLAGCAQPHRIEAVAVNGQCLRGPCTSAMLDAGAPPSTVVEWSSYVDDDGRSRLNGTAGYRITATGNTMTADEAEAWFSR